MNEKEKKVSNLLEINNLFKLESIENINHKPHCYVIGPDHITYASEKHAGILGKETLKAVKCAYPDCRVSYEEHTSDEVCCLSLTKHLTQAEAKKELKFLMNKLGNTFVDGFIFVETKEKFRIEG